MKGGRKFYNTLFLICRRTLFGTTIGGGTILGKNGVQEDGAGPRSQGYLSPLNLKRLFFHNRDFADHFGVL